MNKQATEELQRLQQQSRTGTLRPEQVVEFAKNPDTQLHRYFTWDDGEAAQAYRLLQARELIRVAVVVHEQTSEKIRAFVSLTPDRRNGNGYRATVDVLDNEGLAAQLLADAKADLQAFVRKYERLRSVVGMSDVFEAIDRVVKPKTAKKGKELRPAA